jgi:prepilin-type N-terminal cleavage/methylation domain-containing protein
MLIAMNHLSPNAKYKIQNIRKFESSGFTLVELLITSAIGLIVVVAGAVVSIQGTQATTRLLLAQLLRTDWSRINLLINTDISEACSASDSGGELVLRFTSSIDGQCGPSNPTVTYRISGTTLERVGLPVQRNGTLNLAGTPSAQAIATNVNVFDPSCTSIHNGCFRLSLSESNASFSGDGTQTTGSRTRVRTFD